jgi:metal-responsive CopG/Arc/MetJ family transcriptional regulator
MPREFVKAALDPQLRRTFEQAATTNHQNVSEALRDLIRAYIEATQPNHECSAISIIRARLGLTDH